MEDVTENAAAPINTVAAANGQANNSSDHSETSSPANPATHKKRKSVKDEKDLTVVGKRRKIRNSLLNGFSIDTKTFHDDEEDSYTSPEKPEKVEKPPKTSPAPSQSPPLKKEIVLPPQEAKKLKLPKGYTYEVVVSDVASKSTNLAVPLPNKRERKKSAAVSEDYVSSPSDSKSSKKESRNSSKSNGKRGTTKKESPNNAQASSSRKKQIESQLLSLEQDMAAVSQKIDRKINESFEDEDMEDYQDDDPSSKKRGARKPPVKKISVYDRFDSDEEEEDSPKKVKQSKRIKNAQQAAATTAKNTRTTNVTRSSAAATPAPPPVAAAAPAHTPARPRGRGSRVPHEFDIPEDELAAPEPEPESEVTEPEPIVEQAPPPEPDPEPEPEQSEDPGIMVNMQRLLACHKLLLSITKNKISNPFNQPVDPVALGIPDYFDVIKNPMDFGTILEKIDSGDYERPEEFCADMRLVFSNAMLYNAPGAPVHNMAVTLSQDFERKYHKLGYAKSARPVVTTAHTATTGTVSAEPPAVPQSLGPLPSMNDVDNSATKAQMEQTIMKLRDSNKSVREEIRKLKMERAAHHPGSDRITSPRPSRPSHNNKRARPKAHHPPPPREDVREMTFDEKRNLSNLIGTLAPEALGRVVSIINERNPSFSENPDNEIEIDIDALDAATLRALERYVKSAITKAKKKASTSKAVFAAAGTKDRAAQAELAAQSTTKSIQDVEKRLKEFSKSLKKKKGKKGEEETNEDVVIDDDTPNKEYPSVVIEKDNASSSTSSSSSESSSTDSESSSDSDAEKKKKEQSSTTEETSTKPSTTTTEEKPEQDSKDSTLPVPTSPKSTDVSTTSENSKKEDVKMEDAPLNTATVSTTPVVSTTPADSATPTVSTTPAISTAPTVSAPVVDAPKIITPSGSIVNKEVEFKNLDSWNLDSMEETTSTESQPPATKDDMWSKFQNRDIQNKQREKEREEQEEKEKREKAEREAERRRQEEERKRQEQEEIEKKRQEEEEAKLAFEREIAQKRAAEKAAREQGSSSRNLLDQSLVMSSFEQQGRYDKPPILDMFRMKDDEHKEEGEF